MCTGQHPSYAQKKTAGASKPWLNWLGLLVCIRNTSCWEVVQPLPHIFQKKKSSDLERRRQKQWNAKYLYKPKEERHMGVGIQASSVLPNFFRNYYTTWKLVSMWSETIKYVPAPWENKQQSEGTSTLQMKIVYKLHTDSLSPLYYSGQRQQVWQYVANYLCQLHTENKRR